MADINVADFIVPGGYAMSPPDLPRNTPVFDIAHPVEIGVFPVVRDELDIADFNRLDRGFRQWFYTDIPLVGQIGFDHRMRTIAAGHHQAVIFDLFEQVGGLEVGDDQLACLIAVHADVFFRDQLAFLFLVIPYRCIDGEDVDQAAMDHFA